HSDHHHTFPHSFPPFLLFSPPQTLAELRAQVRAQIGPIATPDMMFVTDALPKTRSGKIMRRLLRKIARCGERRKRKRRKGEAETLWVSDAFLRFLRLCSLSLFASGEYNLGDTSTLSNQEEFDKLVKKVQAALEAKH